MIINEKYFKQYSPIPVNYNMAEIKNYIPVAEKIWVKPLIGYDLFDEIEEQVKNNTVSVENATLLTDGGLWQYLCYATCYEGLAFIWAHCSEVGITLAESDNSKSITLKDLTYINEHLRRQTEFLKDSVKRFICEHYEYYPKADVCACNCSCCNNKASLTKPNPNYELFSTLRKNTNLK